MPHSRSAKKRLRQNVKARSLNRWRRGRIKESTKLFDQAIADADASRAEETYRQTSKILDQIAAKGTIHKNAAARYKSRMAKRLNQLSKKG
ncbi:MAG: 30S ribosomal protein S20 [Phycisphaeraceae bacterium]|nr:30S ribosomal protein S20 [Phycisphaeraceae bacterium]